MDATAGLRGDAQRLSHRIGDCIRVGHWSELDEKDAVTDLLEELRRRLQGKAGLPAAAGTGEGDEARGAEPGAHLGQLGAPADEGGELGREIVRVGRIVEGAQRQKVALQAWADQLVKLLGMPEV